jgi:hypothetical protein
VRNCEDWWEPETVWHRAWKDAFPADWQEVIHVAEDGERHIADVRTPHGLVLEFQHSRLPPVEQAAREAFYGDMVWVVDGTRLKRDVDGFSEWKDYLQHTHLHGISVTMFPHQCFPKAWLQSSALVVFDFEGEELEDEPRDIEAEMWCLFPGRVEGRALVASLPRQDFVRMAREQSFIFEYQGITAIMAEHYRKEEALWFGRSPRSTSTHRHGSRRR